jgi:hypothetical protein
MPGRFLFCAINSPVLALRKGKMAARFLVTIRNIALRCRTYVALIAVINLLPSVAELATVNSSSVVELTYPNARAREGNLNR